MDDRPWWAELLGGSVLAVLIPLLVSTTWGRRWPAGAIVGIALAFLLHVTVVLLVLLGLYWVAESAVSHGEGTGPRCVRHPERGGRRMTERSEVMGRRASASEPLADGVWGRSPLAS